LKWTFEEDRLLVYALYKNPFDSEVHAMSDNLRRYRAIRDALAPCYPGDPKSNRARHLTTLAAVMSGIMPSKTTQLPNIASHVPDGTKAESRVKRFSRWLCTDLINDAVYFIGFRKSGALFDAIIRHDQLKTYVNPI
jgi:hypothetical protein